jgi:hypothetical protein
MPRWRRFHLARHAVESLRQQLPQRPACAVARQHVEIVDVEVALAMRCARLWAVDMREPVVGRDLARHVQDQAAQAVALIGVGIDPPVALLEVFVHRALDIDQRVLERTQPGVLLAVDDVGTRGAPIAGVDQHLFHAVLDDFDTGAGERGEMFEHARGQALRFDGVEFGGGLSGCCDGLADLLRVKRSQ